jgi:uroporphyrinogen III methyltransferase/synthase
LRILLPRAAEAREVLPEGLEEAGAKVDVVPAYRTVADRPPNYEEVIADLLAGEVDAVTFTSSSTVTNFIQTIGKRRIHKVAAKTRFASIGPITSDTMRNNGLIPAIEAKQYTIPGLVTAVRRLLGGRK